MVKRNKRFHAEVATSSLSDIMFFLLLFFLIISTLANPNVIKMTLPKSKTSEKTNKQLISLSITEDKRYYLDKEEIAFADLETTLLSKMGASKDQTWEHQKTKQHAWLDTSTPIKRGRKRVNSDCSHALALEQTLEPTKHF